MQGRVTMNVVASDHAESPSIASDPSTRAFGPAQDEGVTRAFGPAQDEGVTRAFGPAQDEGLLAVAKQVSPRPEPPRSGESTPHPEPPRSGESKDRRRGWVSVMVAIALLFAATPPAVAAEKTAAAAQKAVNLARATVADMRSRSFGNS